MKQTYAVHNENKFEEINSNMKANRFQCVFKVYPSHKQFKLRGRKVYFSRYRCLLLMEKLTKQEFLSVKDVQLV